jgi:hypothetical protein
MFILTQKSSGHYSPIALGIIGLSLILSMPAVAGTVSVATASDLQNAIAKANSSGGNTTILLADGTYTLPDTLYINAPKISIAGQSANREKVIIQGDAMSASASVGNLIRVAASNFQLQDVTLQKSRWHLIQVVGEENADAPVIRNCILRDSFEQMVKVSFNAATPEITGDNGLIENCIFEYSAGIGPQYYIGGIDAHGAKNWMVRNNTFRSIISPSDAVAEFAVHFWNGSANNTVEKNLIVNCDRGIGFGMEGKTPNNGGVIRNNMIYHAANAGQFADTGIALIESPNSQVYNNSIIMDNSFPWAIEYRFANTSGVLIANNLSNKPVMSRDGASGTVSKNVSNAAGIWFANKASGDLHLASAVTGVVASGESITGLVEDFDGQARPSNSIDIGADQLVSVATSPQPPTKLRIVTP